MAFPKAIHTVHVNIIYAWSHGFNIESMMELIVIGVYHQVGSRLGKAFNHCMVD